MVGAGGLGLAAMMEEEEPPPSRWGWVGTKRVAAIILVLLAAEIGYVVHLNTEGTANKSATPTTVPTVPATTAPNLQTPAVAPTTAPAATKPATTPTTAAKPATAPAAVTATTAPLGPCTTSDVNVATTTSGSYDIGSQITITTTVTDVSRCTFTPAAVAPANCPTFITVNGPENWPSPGQEQCNPPAGQTMNPGSSESISVVWTPTESGTYQAVGTWGWESASGPPNQVSVPSPSFGIS